MQAYAIAQNSYTGRIVNENKQPIPDVNVVLYRSSTTVIGYGFSDAQGRFDVSCHNQTEATAIGFILLGFETRRIPVDDFRQGQTVILTSKTFQLREVNVRPEKITQRHDTLVYSVVGFKQAQDRSIADVIAKMPGLEVQQDGRISFEGKPISKFYIEGMDLMGSKYAQASENLRADMVSNVQVLQNHQPVKTLRGVQFSDRTALNIVLKEDVKNAWAGMLDVGMGSAAQQGMDYLYSGRLLAMVFGRKRQNLSMYKADNTGKDIAKEVNDLATMLRDNQKEEGLLRTLVVPTAEIGRQRTTFNHSHLAATNHLMKTAKDNDVRIQMNYLWDTKEGQTAHTMEYLDLDGLILSEENEAKSTESRLKGDFTYKANKDRLYINNCLHGSIEFSRSHGNTRLNNELTTQRIKLRKGYITEDFVLISRLRNGKSIELSSQSTYSQLPGQLLTVEGATERLDIAAFESHNQAAFSHRIKGFTINHKIGYQLKRQQMEVSYRDTEQQEEYTGQNIYAASSLHYQKKSFRLHATVKADFMYRQYEDNRAARFSVQPTFKMQYDCTASTSTSVSYSYRERPASLTNLYRTPIFTSYRTRTSHLGGLEHRGLHSVSLRWTYKQPIRGRFMNLMLSWNRRTNEQLYQSSYNAPVYKRTPTLHRYNADTYLVGGSIAHSFYWSKTLLSLGYQQIWSNYYLLQYEVMTPWQIRNAEVTLKLSMQPHRIFSYELSSRMQTNKQVNRRSSTLSGNRLTRFCHAASLFFFPFKGLELGANADIYHSSDKSVSSNFFADVHISYQWRRYELQFTCNNLLGNHLYENRLRTSVTDVYSAYRLRPREVLLDFSIEF